LCRAWEVENLYVVDGGFFPSSAAVNPALTIAAQALRVARHLLGGGALARQAELQGPAHV
jgi:choline dehydrogenase-like flavoprotein